MKRMSQSRVAMSAIAIAVALGIGGCVQNPDNAVVSGGLTFTEADVSELQDALEEMGQPITREQAVDVFGYFGAVVQTLDQEGIVTLEELSALGEQLVPEQPKGLQVNAALSAVVQEQAAVDPEGMQQLLSAIPQGSFAVGSELNPRYGSLVGNVRNPNLADVVTQTSEVEGLG